MNLARLSAKENACMSLRDSWLEILKTLDPIKADHTEKLVAREEKITWQSGEDIRITASASNIQD